MREIISSYLTTTILNKNSDSITPQENLLDTGLVDSLGMMKLVLFLEKELNMKIPSKDMTYQNFKSVECIESYISKKESSDL